MRTRILATIAWGLALHQSDRAVFHIERHLPVEVVRLLLYSLGIIGAYPAVELWLGDTASATRTAARRGYWLVFVPVGVGVALGHALDVVLAKRRQ